MGFFSRSSDKQSTPWEDLTSEQQLTDALASQDTAVFLFKHSTRCSISTMAKSRFEREWVNPDFPFKLFYLDLLTYRPISSKIEEVTGVQHQSPQLIVVKNEHVYYSESHSAISAVDGIQSLTITN